MQQRPARQRGLGAVAAVAVLVMLSALAAAVVRLGWTEQVSMGQDLSGARATQAAGAGIQWGLYQVFKGTWASTCAGSPRTLDLRAEMGVRVTVSCAVSTYSEGEHAEGVPRQVRLYTLDAVACNGGSACPDNGQVASPAYVERRRTTQVTD